MSGSVKIFVKIIPQGGRPYNLFSANHDRDSTWMNFFEAHAQNLPLQLNPNNIYVVGAQTKKRGDPHSKISDLLLRLTQGSLTVYIRSRLRKVVRHNQNRVFEPQHGNAPTPFFLPPAPVEIRAMPSQPLPPNVQYNMYSGPSTSRMGIQLDLASQQSFQPQNFDHPHGKNMDDEDDNLSVFSQDTEDPEMVQTASELKRQIKMAVHWIPNAHILQMRDEMRSLRRDDPDPARAGRDYKWSHYCPMLSNWLMSAFKV